MSELAVMISKRLTVLLLLMAAGCGGEAGGGTASRGHGSANVVVDTARILALSVPAEHRSGERIFNVHCVACHGKAAIGTAQGPPLLHIYYEPGHHSDAAFQMAVTHGVRQHHWNFGDMPPVPGLGSADVQQIAGYVRWLQREAGVY